MALLAICGIAASEREDAVLVEFENVTLAYDDDADAAPVLDAVDFTLDEGEFRFLTGASGAGKTTLLKLI